jgi:hypothetical protein
MNRAGWHTWLIVAAVLLRSFIAPGYMLAVTGGDLRMTFCYGPVAAAEAARDFGTHHHHPQSDPSGSEDTQSLYVSPSCSFWSASSLLVTSVAPPLPQVAPARHHEFTFHDPLLPARVFDDARAIRAPPVPV